LSLLASTNWVERHDVVGQQLADAAAAQHRLGDQRRLGAVVTGFEEAFEALGLHGFSIGHAIPNHEFWVVAHLSK
jgi:hypothetical protein